MGGSARGWTGGQYSLLRLGLAVALIVSLTLHIHSQGIASAQGAVSASALVLVLALALGFRRRWAAAGLAILSLLGGSVYLVLLMSLHAAAPPAPFGAWDARGRTDPGGDWVMPGWIPRVTQVAVVLGWSLVAFGPWLPLDSPSLEVGFVGLHLLAMEPAWLPPRKRMCTVFYDGSCGLCHRAVRGLIAEDPAGTLFRFAPLGGETFQTTLGTVAEQLPDSMVVQAAEGQLHLQGHAVRFLLDRIGGWWRVCDMVLAVLPAVFRDRLYDLVAGNRYRVFGQQEQACPLSPPEIRTRFLP